MINCISYSSRLKIYIFDEPIPQYYELMLVAASDNKNKLKDNYREDLLKSQLFMTLYEIDGRPAEMMGLYQESWMVPFNAARAFSRLYKSPEFKEYSLNGNGEYGKILNIKLIINFYKDNPQYLKMYNIDTLFFTRHYKQAKQNTVDYILKKFNTSFIKQNQLYIYKKVPQYFYVMGDPQFLTSLKPFNE